MGERISYDQFSNGIIEELYISNIGVGYFVKWIFLTNISHQNYPGTIGIYLQLFKTEQYIVNKVFRGNEMIRITQSEFSSWLHYNLEVGFLHTNINCGFFRELGSWWKQFQQYWSSMIILNTPRWCWIQVTIIRMVCACWAFEQIRLVGLPFKESFSWDILHIIVVACSWTTVFGGNSPSQKDQGGRNKFVHNLL